MDKEEEQSDSMGEDYSSENSESDVELETRNLVREQNRKKKKSGGFQVMGLGHPVFKGVLHKGYKIPTPIQRKAIPLILDGKDVVAMARTGSGKTASFLIPMFEKLRSHSGQAGARALIMSPTRELALQTLKFTKDLGKYTGLKAAVVLGGDSMDDQFEALHSNPDVIIATPGRFMHVVVEMNLKLSSVEYVVFDEADRLFEMGFETQLREVIHRLSDKRQTVLFSATLPKGLVEFAKAGLHHPTLIRLDVDSKLSPNLQTQYLRCRTVDKDALLLHLLTHVIKPGELTVVFLATKHHVEYINMLLQKADISCCCVYSSLDQSARKINVAKFMHRKCSVMLVTDLAARGIDIPILDNVINFHFPAKGKLFVHRVGRVARAGRTGTAYSLVAPDEMPYLLDLHLFLGKPVKWVTDANKQTVKDGMVGHVPQALLDNADADIRLLTDNSHDWNNMTKVCGNGYNLYLKSRPAASSESIKRMKELDCVTLGFHPLLEPEDASEKARVNILTNMKHFRPKNTIFEIGGNNKTPGFSVMQVKRKKHSTVIAASMERKADIMSEFIEQQSKKPAELSGSVAHEMEVSLSSLSGFRQPKTKKRKLESVKDEDNYISYRPSDYNSEQGLGLANNFDQQAKGAVLDLTGDDNDQIRGSQNRMKWDRKKKRFVGQTGNQGNNKKIKTESGQWINASYKSDAYQMWLRKSKTKEQEEYASDDEQSKPSRKGRGGQNNRIQIVGHKPFRHRNDNKEPKDKRRFKREIRTKDEIVKNRNVKEKQQFHQKRRELANKSKGGRGGGQGGSGRGRGGGRGGGGRGGGSRGGGRGGGRGRR